MSSILKALQKLESESLKKGAGESWPHSFNAGKESPETQGRVRSTHILILVCIGLILSGSTTIILLKFRPAFTTSVSELQPANGTGGLIENDDSASGNLIADKTIEGGEEDKTVLKSGTQPEIGVAKKNEDAIREPAVIRVDKENAKEPGSEGLPVYDSDAKKTSLDRKVALNGSERRNAISEPRKTSVNSSQPGSIENPKTALNQKKTLSSRKIEKPSEPTDSILVKIMHNPEIELHAISWTPDANTRIAVINGNIVREGNRVGGYLVYKINKDDIVLKENDELLRLFFRGH